MSGAPGEPFQIAAWDYWQAAFPYAEAGDAKRAAEIAAEGLERYPAHAALLYNLACYESLDGSRDQALEHLQHAVELDPVTRDWAREDADFDPIRDDPQFPT